MSTWLLCAGLGACGGRPSTPPPASAPAPAAAAPAVVHPDEGARGTWKPSAPIDLHLAARPLASAGGVDRYEVVLTAAPRRDVDRVELAIDGRPAVVLAATAAGVASEARATIELAHGDGRDVVATAVVLVDGKKLGAATQVRIGAPAAAEPAGTIIRLPDGTEVREVRP